MTASLLFAHPSATAQGEKLQWLFSAADQPLKDVLQYCRGKASYPGHISVTCTCRPCDNSLPLQTDLIYAGKRFMLSAFCLVFLA